MDVWGNVFGRYTRIKKNGWTRTEKVLLIVITYNCKKRTTMRICKNIGFRPVWEKIIS